MTGTSSVWKEQKCTYSHIVCVKLECALECNINLINCVWVYGFDDKMGRNVCFNFNAIYLKRATIIITEQGNSCHVPFYYAILRVIRLCMRLRWFRVALSNICMFQ